MDLQSAEKYVNKLLEYTQMLSSSNSNMYRKSKDRLKNIAYTCDQVIKLISEILKDEAMEDYQEFEENVSEDIISVVSSMQSELSELKRFVKFPDADFNTSSKLLKDDKKVALMKYGDVLKSVANADIPYDSVSSCASMIWKWFNSRFYETSKLYPSFRYNMMKFPIWLRDIVIMYGCYEKRNESMLLEMKFQQWCDNLLIPEIGSRFAIPYELYQFEKNMTSAEFTLTSVIIWDILLDYGYRELCTLDPNDIYLCEDSVYNLCGKYNPQLLDGYVDYKLDSSILSRCNLQEVAE